jgi:tetratricopeptide (TPR) repeat protein
MLANPISVHPLQSAVPILPIKPAMTRREKIEAMLADDPDDTFLRYSLAMELDKEGNHDASLAAFAELTHDSPPYVPAFFMAGQQLVRIGRIDEAKQVLRDGIAAANAAGDAHAEREMREFLVSLESPAA